MKDFINDKIIDLWPLHLIVTLPIVSLVVCVALTGQTPADYFGLNG